MGGSEDTFESTRDLHVPVDPARNCHPITIASSSSSPFAIFIAIVVEAYKQRYEENYQLCCEIHREREEAAEREPQPPLHFAGWDWDSDDDHFRRTDDISHGDIHLDIF